MDLPPPPPGKLPPTPEKQEAGKVTCPKCRSPHTIPPTAVAWKCPVCGLDVINISCYSCKGVNCIAEQTLRFTCAHCGKMNKRTDAADKAMRWQTTGNALTNAGNTMSSIGSSLIMSVFGVILLVIIIGIVISLGK